MPSKKHYYFQLTFYHRIFTLRIFIYFFEVYYKFSTIQVEINKMNGGNHAAAVVV